MRSFLIFLVACSAKESGKILDIPTLGRPVLLGELYSVYSDQTLPGFSLWRPEDIERSKQIVYHPSSHTELSAEDSKDNKFSRLQVDAELKASFKAGLVKVFGSAGYLNKEKNDDEKASVTLSFQSTTRTESLSKENVTQEDICNLKMKDEDSQPTHVIASITYGGDCHFVFEKELLKTDDVTDIYGKLRIEVNAKVTQITGQASVNLTNNNTEFTDTLNVELYSDFILEEQPQTFNDSLKVYKEVSQNFGTVDSLYNHSVPMRIKLIPIDSYCDEATRLIGDIGKSILETATEIRVKLISVLQKIARLLSSIAATNNYLIKQLLQEFQSDVSNFTLNYEANLQRIIIAGRRAESGSKEELVQLIENNTASTYNYDKYLTERTRQVNALNIFYKQTVGQIQPQIAKYSQADIPIALITEPVLFLLTLYVSPNVSDYNYTTWKKEDESERWYNNRTTVMSIGRIWRDFRNFFHVNNYKEGTNFFVLFEDENSKENEDDLLNIQLYIEGKMENFELNRLLQIDTQANVTRKAGGRTIEIEVKPYLTNDTSINSITGIMVSLSSQSLPEQNFRKIYQNTTITIDNIVPEYTYNVSVSYNTKYGSLTPTIITSHGTFDEMEQTVGCNIQRNLMTVNISEDHQDTIKTSITADECANECRKSIKCSYGWTFQISTGNCYFNKKNSNTTGMNGWAVGTQSCGLNKECGVQTPCNECGEKECNTHCLWNKKEEKCKEKEVYTAIYIGPGRGSNGKSEVLSWPDLTSIDCNIPVFPGGKYSGYVGRNTYGGIMLCGGFTKNFISSCHMLAKNGQWFGPAPLQGMKYKRSSAASVQLSSGWWVTGGRDDKTKKTTELWQHDSWHDSVELPEPMYGHCVVKLNRTHVMFTGGYSSGSLNSAYIYSEKSGFVQQKNMINKRSGHGCALVGDDIVFVAGGGSSDLDKSEYFDLSSLKWAPGPDLPAKLTGIKMLTLSEKTILLGNDKKILQLEPVDLGGKWWQWNVIGKMKYETSDFDAIPINNQQYICAD